MIAKEDKVFKKQNDFSCEAYQGSRKVNHMKYVGNMKSYIEFLERKHITWSVINIYARRSGDFIKRHYKGNIIPTYKELTN